jgi:O-antigen/teichoic acid export membrane protein
VEQPSERCQASRGRLSLNGMDEASANATLARTRIGAHLASPLYRNAYFLIIGAGAGSLLGFVFWTLAAHYYSEESVGRNFILISAMMIASSISQLGLSGVLVRYLPRAGASTRSLVVRAYALTSALSVVVGLSVALTSGLWAPGSGFVHRSVWWVLAFVAATATWTIFSIQDSVLTGLRQARWVPLENSLFSAIKVVLLVAFVGVSPRAGIFLAWCVPVVALLPPVSLLIFRYLIPRHLESSYQTPLRRGTLVRLAAGIYAGGLFFIASTTLLPIIVGAEVGARQTAYFSIPWTIASGVQLVALNMTTSLTVEVAYDESKLREYFRRIMWQTMRLVVPVVAILAAGAHYVLLVFGNAYAREGATCLRLLALTTIPNVVVMLGVSIVRIHHDARMALLIPGAVGVLTIGLALVLLPHVGIAGVGWASLLAQFAVALWLLAGPLRPVFLARA